MRAWLLHNRFLVVFALLASLMGTSVGVAKIVTSLYALELGASHAQLGLIASGQMIGTLVMSVHIGFLVDRYGPARLFVTGSALAGLGYAIVPWAATPWFLLGCSTAISFFMPLRFVSLNSVFFEQIRTLGENKAGWYRGTHMSGMFLVGPALGVSLVAWIGYCGTWWVIAASFALTIALSPIVFARYARPAQSGPRSRPAAVRRELGALLRDRDLRITNLVDFCAQSTHMYFSTFILVIALDSMRLDAARASAYLTGSGLVYIATLFLLGDATARLGLRRSYLAGFGLVALALVLLGRAPGAAWLWPGVLLQGLGLGLLQIVSLTRIAGIGARLGRGKVSGANLLVGPLGSLCGSAAGGLLGDVIGLQNVFFIFLPLYGLLAFRFLRIADSTPAVAPSSGNLPSG